MKTAVSMTTHVIEWVCQLPGVATLDWCDRAATAACRSYHPARGVVVAGSVDQRCVLTHLEATGVGGSRGPDGEALARAEAEGLREQFRDGEWVGWTFAVPQRGATVADVVRVAPTAGRRNATPLGLRWESLGVTELLVGAVGLPGPTGGRVLLAEVGLVNPSAADLVRLQTVFAAALPLLGVRYAHAIGHLPADRHSWLTPREETILWKLVAGKKVPQIANELHRSVYTVHDHVKSLHRKLGATNRGQLVSRALGHLGPLVSQAADAIGDPEGGRDEAARAVSGRRDRD
ncbi:MAG: response regulator transcription factor [Phycisphaerales bacterium]